MSSKKKLNPRKKATQGRAKETVRSIVEATTHIIEKSGIEEISTNKIAKKAGVSIGSLYQYFPSKESILIFLVEKELTGHVENIETHISQMDEATIEEFIDEITETILTMFEQKKRIRFLLYKFLPRGLTPLIHDIEDQLQKIIYEKLRSYPEMKDKKNLESMVYVVVHSVIGVVHSKLAKGRKLDEEQVKMELKKMIKNYLLQEI